MRPLTPDQRSDLTLAPLKFLPAFGRTYNQAARQWDLPETTVTKRSYSPPGYEQDLALKAGARPDTVHEYTPATALPGPDDIIEADTDSAQEHHHPCLNYTRANGDLGRKVGFFKKADVAGRL